MNELSQFTNNAIFQYALIFCRLGSIMLFIPGFGETYVAVRARLMLALILCLVFYPILSPILPTMPADIWSVALIMAGEIVVGLFIGLMMRGIQAILHIAGMKMAFMTGLSTATLFDTNQATQGSVTGSFLSLVGITIFFTSNLDQYVFKAFANSFVLIQVAHMPPLNEFADMMAKMMSEIFFIAFKIAAPIVMVGTMLYVSAGLMGRLMPTMQVFFILMPLQIYAGFLFMAMALSGMMLVYINFFEDKLQQIFQF